MRVDFVASQPHYLDHLAPVWRTLSAEERGEVLVPQAMRRYAFDVLGNGFHRYPRGNVRIAASFADLDGPPNDQKRVLMEHGIGQGYVGVSSPRYIGAAGREFVIDLFLMPHHDAAARQPGNVVVVGSPYLDELKRRVPPAYLTPNIDVAFSFHFDADVCPETTSGFPWFRNAILQCRDRGITVLGHGHPRHTDVWRWYEDHHVFSTRRFDLVPRLARVYVCDNSSTLFYAAALGMRVVVLNPPQYRRHVEHGIRFWDMADIGEQVDHPDDVHAAVHRALRLPDAHEHERQRVVAALFPFADERSAERCVEALRANFNS